MSSTDTGGHAEETEKRNPEIPPYTLRVRGGDPHAPDPAHRPTDPAGLSRSILHTLKKNPEGWANIQSVGAKALEIACQAVELANQEVTKRTSATVLVMRPSSYTAEINGKPARGKCLRVHPIPIKDAI